MFVQPLNKDLDMTVAESSVTTANVVSAILTLGDALGLAIRIENPSPEIKYAEPGEDREAQIAEQQRYDFSWLETHQEVIARLRGNYVAVFDERIISVGPDEATVRLGAFKRLETEKVDVLEDEILVVPLGVPGSESVWEEIKAKLGLE